MDVSGNLMRAWVGPRSGSPWFLEPSTIVGATPAAICAHEVHQRAAYRFVRAGLDWPSEKLRILGGQRDKHEAGPELGDSIVGGLEDPPFRLVAEFGEPGQEAASVMFKLGRRKARNVLEKNRAWFDVCDQFERSREHVPVVLGAELLAGDAKRRTGNAGGKEIDAGEVFVTQVADVLLVKRVRDEWHLDKA